MCWVLRYARYMVEHDAEYETLDEALRAAERGSDAGQLYPLAVLYGGAVVLDNTGGPFDEDRSEINDLCSALYDEG